MGQGFKVRINVLHGEGERLWAGTEKGLSVSRDAGKTWRDLGQTQLGDVRSIASTAEAMILGTKNGLWRAAKGGGWSSPDSEFKGQFVRAVATDGAKFFAGTDHGKVFVSEDAGVTWRGMSDGLPEMAQVFELKTSLDGALFAGLYSKGFYGFQEGTWRNLGAKFGFSILPLEKEVFVAGGNPGGIVRSEDGGKSWSDARGLPENAPSWMLFRNKERLFYGTSGRSGLYRSDDMGKSWAALAEKEFGNKAVVSMAAVGEALVVATVGSSKKEALDVFRGVGLNE